jgi:hypothetical protein
MSGVSTLGYQPSELAFHVSGPTAIFHSWQRCPNDTWWSDATPLGGECLQLAIGRNEDGRLEVFYIKAVDNCIYHKFQAVPNGPFQAESALGGTPAKQVTIGNNADGRMEVFYIGTDDCIYHKFQGVPNGPFQNEYALGGMTAQQINVGQNADGRMEVFYIGSDDAIYHKFQGVPNCLASTNLSGALTRQFCYRAGGRCLIENATEGYGTPEGNNEEADQADYASGSDVCNQPAI